METPTVPPTVREPPTVLSESRRLLVFGEITTIITSFLSLRGMTQNIAGNMERIIVYLYYVFIFISSLTADSEQ